ncbi:MAG: RHS repeat-associated core domain-containing protein [Phycisphaerae bacterium]
MTDAQHNVTAMVAENGQVVERYAYDPYGRVLVLNGENDPDGAEYTPDADGLSDVGNVILYAGYRFDAATGLYQVRRRYHHPTLGRWINRDPKGYVDGMNLYQYVASRPTAATDPMGTEKSKRDLPPERDWGKTVKEVIETIIYGVVPGSELASGAKASGNMAKVIIGKQRKERGKTVVASGGDPQKDPEYLKLSSMLGHSLTFKQKFIVAYTYDKAFKRIFDDWESEQKSDLKRISTFRETLHQQRRQLKGEMGLLRAKQDKAFLEMKALNRKMASMEIARTKTVNAMEQGRKLIGIWQAELASARSAASVLSSALASNREEIRDIEIEMGRLLDTDPKKGRDSAKYQSFAMRKMLLAAEVSKQETRLAATQSRVGYAQQVLRRQWTRQAARGAWLAWSRSRLTAMVSDVHEYRKIMFGYEMDIAYAGLRINQIGSALEQLGDKAGTIRDQLEIFK